MPLDTAPKLTRRRNLAFALETTTGTAASLAAAQGTQHVFNPTLTYDTEEVERDAQGTSISPIATARGARAARCTFETEMAGSGWADLLKACGMTVSGGVYSPITPATDTVTIGYYTSGLLRKLIGGMGTFTMTLRRGQKGRIAWDFSGVQDQPSDTANIAPTYSTTVAPRVGATAFTVGGATYRVPEITLEMGNTVTLREDILGVDSASEATGYRAGMITNRRAIVRMSPEAVPLSTRDWYDVYRDGTLLAMSCAFGANTGSIYTLAAPKMQLISNPVDEDRGGLLAHGLTFLCTRSLDAGDDDWTLTIA